MIVRKAVFSRFLRRLSLSDKFRIEDLDVEVAMSDDDARARMMSPEPPRDSGEREEREERENRIVDEVADREVTKW